MLAKRKRPSQSKLTIHEAPPHKCAIGVYPGVRQFEGGGTVVGVFGMTGVFPECHEPVTARCQLFLKGHLHPYYWYACDNPEHRRDAGVIEHLDREGNVVRVTRLLKGTWQDDPPKLPGKRT